MKLRAQLLLPPLLTAVVAVACGLTYGALEQRVAVRVTAAEAADVQRLTGIGQVQTDLSQVRGDVMRTLTLMSSLGDPEIKQIRARLADQVGTLQRRLAATAGDGAGSGAGPDPEIAKQLAAAAPLFAEYLRQCDRAIDLSGMDPNIGIAAMRAAEDSYAKLTAAAAAIMARTDTLRGERARAAAADRTKLSLVLGGLMLLATAGALGFAWRIQRRILGQFVGAVQLAEGVARGRLDLDEQPRGADEIGDLMRALERMVRGLRDSLHTVRGATDHIGTASREIASGNQDLSSRTEQTASNLQQAASSLAQLTGTVGSTADSARTANQLAASAAEVAQRGGSVVAQVVSTMDEISGSSRKISEIIGTIDGIAFQTNILALNAAVEAARAGEQGRGFAVVASEVRALAQRSAAAAREIKSLIQASVERVDTGSKLVGDAGSTMHELVASVQRVRDIIGEISSAAAEQSGGIGQVNRTVTELDRMTQQNAALVEESAAAAESLRDQAHKLAEVLDRFELGGAPAPVAPSAAADAPGATPAQLTRAALSQVAAAPGHPGAGRPARASAAPRVPAAKKAQGGEAETVRATAAPAAATTTAPASLATAGSAVDHDGDWATF